MARSTWAKTERVRGDRETNAAMVFTSACLRYGMDVKAVTHIPGEDNDRCDKRSSLAESGLSTRTAMDAMGLATCGVLDLLGNAGFQRLVELCSPGREFANEECFAEFWAEIRGALAGFREEAPSTERGVRDRG